MSDSRYDLTLLGATGFTGAYVASEIVTQLHTFGPHFKWAIAGRRQASLDQIREQLASAGCPNERLPGLILTDVKDDDSLVRTCLQTKLLLSCVGPYAFLGEPVVKAVLKASAQLKAEGKPPCDYADLCGEPNWIEKMTLLYHEEAAAVGTTILFAAGFDSIPADAGVLTAKRELARAGGKEAVSPTSIEMIFRMHADPKVGFGIHYATYAAAVNGFATRKELGVQRKKLYSTVLKTDRTKPRAVESGLCSGLPRRKGRFGGAILWAEDQGTYLIPFFFADPSIIRLTQALDQKLGTGVEPVVFRAWIAVPTLPILLLTLVSLALFGLLADRAWGRKFLLAHPKFCSMGLVSHDGPTPAQLAASGFTSTFVARGHSETILRNAQPGSKMGPDVKVEVKVRGPEVGYQTTPIAYIAAARVMLQQRDKVRKGTLTPGVALAETTLVDDLNKDGRLTVKRTS